MRDRPDDEERSAAVAHKYALTDAQFAFADALGNALAQHWTAVQMPAAVLSNSMAPASMADDPIKPHRNSVGVC